MNIQTVLFDLDGTLFDTQIFHAEAEAELMKLHGVTIRPEELTLRYAGRPTVEVFQEVLGCSKKTAEMLSKKKWEKIIPQAHKAKPLCNLQKLFLELDQRDVDFGIGSSSPSDWVWKLIELHCPRQYFTIFNVVCGDEVTKGKPNPEVWLRIARDITHDYPPDNCLVVEDGLAGIEGAVSAGMHSALILPNKHPKAIQIKNVRDILMII